TGQATSGDGSPCATGVSRSSTCADALGEDQRVRRPAEPSGDRAHLQPASSSPRRSRTTASCSFGYPLPRRPSDRMQPIRSPAGMTEQSRSGVEPASVRLRSALLACWVGKLLLASLANLRATVPVGLVADLSERCSNRRLASVMAGLSRLSCGALLEHRYEHSADEGLELGLARPVVSNRRDHRLARLRP